MIKRNISLSFILKLISYFGTRNLFKVIFWACESFLEENFESIENPANLLRVSLNLSKKYLQFFKKIFDQIFKNNNELFEIHFFK